MPALKDTGARKMNDLGSTQDSRDDAVLLQSVAEQRDRTAFDELYRRYERTAYNLARHLTGNHDRAAEAVQEAMLRVWTRAANFRPDGKARGWILRIVVRESLRTGRKRSGEQLEDGYDLEVRANPEPEGGEGIEKMVQDERLSTLRASIEHLPLGYRRILALYYGAGLTQREIGEELNVSQRTVSAQLEEALRRLRSKLSQVGVATIAPLLGTNAITEALVDGHLPPTHLAETIRSRLGEGVAQAGQVSRSLSRKAFAVSGGSRLLLAGILVVVAVGAAGYWAIREYGTSDERTAKPDESSEMLEASAAPEIDGDSLRSVKWEFTKRPPEGFRLLRGEWKYEEGVEGGSVSAVSSVFIVLPSEVRPRPMVVEHELAQSGSDGRFRFGLYWFREEPQSWVQEGHEVFNLKIRLHAPKPPFTIRHYVVGTLVITECGGKVACVARYETPYSGNRLVLSFTGTNVRTIRLREIPDAEVPEAYRNPEALIASLKIMPEIWPRSESPKNP